jgi:hypothetical protein
MRPARTASLGELVAAAYDFANEQSADPKEVAELVASVVGDLRDRSLASRRHTMRGAVHPLESPLVT